MHAGTSAGPERTEAMADRFVRSPELRRGKQGSGSYRATRQWRSPCNHRRRPEPHTGHTETGDPPASWRRHGALAWRSGACRSRRRLRWPTAGCQSTTRAKPADTPPSVSSLRTRGMPDAAVLRRLAPSQGLPSVAVAVRRPRLSNRPARSTTRGCGRSSRPLRTTTGCDCTAVPGSNRCASPTLRTSVRAAGNAIRRQDTLAGASRFASRGWSDLLTHRRHACRPDPHRARRRACRGA